MAEGVYIEAHIDAKNVSKELEKELAKIQKLSADIEVHTTIADNLDAEIRDRVKAIEKLEQNGGSATRLAELNAEQDKAIAKADKIGEKLAKWQTELDHSKERAAELKEQLGQTAPETQKSESALDKFAKRLSGLVKRVFIFSVLTSALRKMREYLGEAIKQNAEASASFAKLKGAIRTVAQPIVNALIPALTFLANMLRVILIDIARFLALFSKNGLAGFSAQAEDIADSMESTASSATKAKKALAGFDEINTLSFGGGGGGGGSTSITPDFNGLDEAETKLRVIATIVELIALAFVSWKLANFIAELAQIPMTMGQMLGFASSIAGAFLLIKSVCEMWANGIDWKNLGVALAGIALIVGGLAVSFGAMAATIGGLVSGVLLLAVGVKDVADNGFNPKNLTAIELGLLAIGVALASATGGLSVLIAAIIGLVVAIIANWDKIKEATKKAWNWIKDFLTKLWESLKAMWGVLAEWFGNLWGKVKDVTKKVWAVIKEVLVTFWHGLQYIWGSIVDFFKGIWDKVKGFAVDAWEGIKSVFSKLGDFFGSILSKAWQKIKDVFSKGGAIFNSVTEGIANAFKKIVNSLISGINKVIAIPFNAINAALRKIRDINILGITPFKWIQTISVPQIPYLASGAVVPPNREFLAMLGDNKKETEIVSPLSTMKQALIEALEQSGQNQTIVVNVDGQKLFDIIVNRNNNTVRRTGATPLLV